MGLYHTFARYRNPRFLPSPARKFLANLRIDNNYLYIYKNRLEIFQSVNHYCTSFGPISVTLPAPMVIHRSPSSR